MRPHSSNANASKAPNDELSTLKCVFFGMDVLSHASGDSANAVVRVVDVALEWRHAGRAAAAHELLLEAVVMARRIDAATAGGGGYSLLAETIDEAVVSCSALGLREQALALAHEAYDARRRALAVRVQGSRRGALVDPVS